MEKEDAKTTECVKRLFAGEKSHSRRISLIMKGKEENQARRR